MATRLRWTIPFKKEVALYLSSRKKPNRRIVRFRPKSKILRLGVCNRELDELLGRPRDAQGGLDDPEFMVYGDSIQGGKPRILRSVGGPKPAGRKACGVGGIQA